MKKLIVVLIGAGLCSLAFSANALAASIVVDSDSDVSGNGPPCTLREAVVSAEFDGTIPNNGCVDGLDADAISFDPAVFVPGGAPDTIDLVDQTLNLQSDLSITGPGAPDLILDGATGERVIFVNDGDEVALEGLTVTGGDRNVVGGSENGGGIRNDGDLTLTEVTVSGNRVIATANNPAHNMFAGGGGIYNIPGAILTLTDSVVRDNTASALNPDVGVGGAEGFGGAIFNDGGTVNVHGSVIDDNHAIAQEAGGGGFVQAYGGGIHSTAAGTVAVDHTQITRNDATASGANTAVIAQGGGVAAGTSTITIEETTIADNAIAASDTGGGVITQRGGGIYNGAATLNLISDTIARNGPAGNGVPANIANTGGTTRLENTIVSDPLGAGSVNCGLGTKTTGGFNVDFNAAATPTCGLGGTELTSDPQLAGGLAFNGGPTETVALEPSSPAIDAGSSTGQGLPFLIEDQRRFLRPVDFTGVPDAAGGNGTDIGAYEVQRACSIQATPSDSCPTPASNSPALAPAATPTGARAAALKKCKKRKSSTARKKCKKKARKLPV
jgi:hypothetical protein